MWAGKINGCPSLINNNIYHPARSSRLDCFLLYSSYPYAPRWTLLSFCTVHVSLPVHCFSGGAKEIIQAPRGWRPFPWGVWMMIVLQGAYTCRVLLPSFLHGSHLVCRVKLATLPAYRISGKLLRFWIFITIRLTFGLFCPPYCRWCHNYVKQLIRFLCNLSGNSVQLRWWVVHKRIWSVIENYGSNFLILRIRFEAKIFQNDRSSLLLFHCYVYWLCETGQCIPTIFGQKRYFWTRSSPSRYYSPSRKSVSKSIHHGHTN